MRRRGAAVDVERKGAPQVDDAGTGLGRMALQKAWHGEVQATSRGEMLTAMGAGKGSGAYVAVERVTGTVLGRKGSFSLVHRGVMASGQQELSITVVPGSRHRRAAGPRGDGEHPDRPGRTALLRPGGDAARQRGHAGHGQVILAAGLPDQMSPPCG